MWLVVLLGGGAGNGCAVHRLGLPLRVRGLVSVSSPMCAFYRIVSRVSLSECFMRGNCGANHPEYSTRGLLGMVLFTFVRGNVYSLQRVRGLYHGSVHCVCLLSNVGAPSFTAFKGLVQGRLASSVRRVFRSVGSCVFAGSRISLRRACVSKAGVRTGTGQCA